jgi:hypothetical protein
MIDNTSREFVQGIGPAPGGFAVNALGLTLMPSALG